MDFRFLAKPVGIFLWCIATIFASSVCCRANPYTFTTIAYPGAFNTTARGINNAGHIVGSYSDGATYHGFLFDGVDYTTIDYPGAFVTGLYAINNYGHIVGIYDHDHVFLYDGNEYWVLEDFGVDDSGYGINDSGHIVGAGTGQDALFYDGNIYTDFSYPSALLTRASGINNEDEIVGYNNVQGGYFYDGTTYTTIHYPNAFGTYATDINNVGLVIGDFHDNSGNRGFIYDGEKYTIFVHPEAPSRTYPMGINDLGYIVGDFYPDLTRCSFLAVPNPVSIPSANFIADNTSGLAPLTVKFTDESTGTIDEWTWDFGDGYTSTYQNPTHLYEYAGTYDVSLTVSNSAGSSDPLIKANYITVISKNAPDLVISCKAFHSRFFGKEIKVESRLDNWGNTDAGSFEVELYRSVDGMTPQGEPVDSKTVRGLKAGLSKNINLEYSSEIPLTGTYFIGMVDSLNRVLETDETNNSITALIP